MAKFRELLNLVAEPGLFAPLYQLLTVLSYRALAPFIYCLLRPKTASCNRIFVVASYITIIALSGAQIHRTLLDELVGLTYYAVATMGTHWLSRRITQLRGFDGFLMFSFMWLVFLLVPSTMMQPVSQRSFLFMGWELTLKSYSYLAEGGARRLTWKQCLFFFLVDPTIVLPDRAQGQMLPMRRSIGRLLLGASVLYIAFCIDPLAAAASVAPDLASAAWLAPAILARGIVRLLLTYAKHSGVASVQIALMALVGFRVPERYRYPLMARTPAEFWARWNTYVAGWAKRYIYQPIGLRMARAAKRRRLFGGYASLVAAAAVSYTFFCMGILHDLYTWMESGRASPHATCFFLANGALVLIGARLLDVRLRSHGTDTRAFENVGWRRATLIVTLLTVIGLSTTP